MNITHYQAAASRYLPPNTSECALFAGWYSIFLPWKDGRLSWPRWLGTWFTCWLTVTYQSSNWTQCQLTTLMEANVPISTQSYHHNKAFQNMPKCTIEKQKSKNFLEWGHSPWTPIVAPDHGWQKEDFKFFTFARLEACTQLCCQALHGWWCEPWGLLRRCSSADGCKAVGRGIQSSQPSKEGTFIVALCDHDHI